MSKKMIFTCLALIVAFSGLFAQLSSSAQEAEEGERRIEEQRRDRPPGETRRDGDRDV